MSVFYNPFENIRTSTKRCRHRLYESEEECDNDDMSSEDSDENHREIDYPDERDYETDIDNQYSNDEYEEYEIKSHRSDDEFSENQYLNPEIYPNINNNNPLLISDNKLQDCHVCFQQFYACRFRLDELDQNISKSFPHNYCFLNPCCKHYICGKCIRNSLLSPSVSSILQQGNGNFPCLGDINCSNSLGHRTTSVLNQIKDLFNEIEWQTIINIKNNIQLSQEKNANLFQPFVSPLVERQVLTDEQIYSHISRLLNQDKTLVYCPICVTSIEKSTACYCMRHCDWEICWMCHHIERRIDAQHWKECPRYDHDKFWKSKGFQCEEDKCYSELTSCSVTSHDYGKNNMEKIRKAYQIIKFYYSLTEKQQHFVQDKLIQNSLKVCFDNYMDIYNLNKYKSN